MNASIIKFEANNNQHKYISLMCVLTCGILCEINLMLFRSQ